MNERHRSEGGTPGGGEMFELTPEQVDLGRLAVARRARDADDCRELLEMLGLVEPLVPSPQRKTKGG